MRRHGWQRPFHPLQILGMVVFVLLLVAFYCFLGLLLGNKIAEITVISGFSVAAASAALLFIRCTAIDPSDRTRFRIHRKRKKNRIRSSHGLNYGFLLFQVLAGFFKRMERKILRTCIQRKYVVLDPSSEPLFPFPLVLKKDQDDSIAPDSTKWNDISFCSLCDFEVQKHSKHCRTCDRCVEGFDHHCRWLNNCVGKKNYTTFFLLMVSVMLMLIIEGGTAVAVFIRCFADRRGMEKELIRSNFVEIPRGAVAALSALLVLATSYCTAAMGQLFLFHVLLIRKGMRTYDYILAMKEKNRLMEMEALEDSDFSSSDDDEDFDSISPEKPKFISCLMRSRSQMGGAMNKNFQKLSIMIHGETGSSSTENKKQAFHASINPWNLITMSQEKTLLAATQAKEKLMKEKKMAEHESMKPLPLETKSGPSVIPSLKVSGSLETGLTTLVLNSKEWLPGSPAARFSSPRLRRLSHSPTQSPGSMATRKERCRSNFDLQLTKVSRELETHISRQVLSSILKDGLNEV